MKKKKFDKIHIKKQLGFTLIEMVMVMALAGLMMMIEIEKKTHDLQEMQARTLGVEIYNITKGISEYINANSSLTTTDLFEPKIGVDWLRTQNGVSLTQSECNNKKSNGFINCNFLPNNQTTFGRLNISTSFIHEPFINEDGSSSPTKFTVKGITVFDKLILGSDEKPEEAPELSGLAAMVASGSNVANSSSTAFLSGISEVHYCITENSNICAGHLGKIVAVSNLNPSNDVWIRTDHGNNMNNIFEFNKNIGKEGVGGTSVQSPETEGFSLRQIKNVARIFNSVNGEPLILGADRSVFSDSALDPILSQAGVVVDADMLLYKKLAVLSNATFKENVEMQKDLNVKGKLLSSDLVDLDDNAYKVDPDKDSLVNNLNIKGITKAPIFIDSDNEIFRVDPDKVSKFNNLTSSYLSITNDFKAKSLVDWDDPHFILDPNETSILNSINVNNMKVNQSADLPSNSTIVINGRKQLIPELLKYVLVDTKFVKNGDSIFNKPDCHGGIPKIQVIPMNVGINTLSSTSFVDSVNRAYISKGAFKAYATSGATSWHVYLRTFLPGKSHCVRGTPGCNPAFRGDSYSFAGNQGLVNIYCYYG